MWVMCEHMSYYRNQFERQFKEKKIKPEPIHAFRHTHQTADAALLIELSR